MSNRNTNITMSPGGSKFGRVGIKQTRFKDWNQLMDMVPNLEVF